MIHTNVDSPIGPLLVTAEPDDSGPAITGVWTAGNIRRPGTDAGRADDTLSDIRTQLEQYFAGERQNFDVRLSPAGTAFQRRVWAALCTVEYARTVSYGWIASSIGSPTAMRAVGGANGRNPISILVPCHRVVGANGLLTGYAGGMTAKRWLLEHELHHAGRGPAPLIT
jgi:methylated-DNA-[protein]-cysteine S-methyltransferase